jgi:DNA-binding transcriptional MerR regulator
LLRSLKAFTFELILPESLFTLSQVAELTEIPSQTIYAWERRYRAIVPTRTAGQRRIYTQKQLLRLKLLKACVSQGARIGTIAHLTDASLEELMKRSGEHPVQDLELVENALALHHDALDRKIGLDLATSGAALFADQTLSPLMSDLGGRWQRDPSAILAEHTITTSAKSILFTALRMTRPRFQRATAVFATPVGELHELGLLSAAVAAQTSGVSAVYLGPQVPTELLPQIVQTCEARMVVIASSILEPEALLPSITELRNSLPTKVELYVGGYSFVRLERKMPSGIMVLNSIKEFENHLRPRSR